MILLAGLAAGAGLGLASGGQFRNLAHARLRGEWWLLAALVLQGALPSVHAVGIAGQIVFVGWVGTFLVLLAVCLANYTSPGLIVAGAGVLLNTVVIAMNGGMPVSASSVTAVTGIAAPAISPSDFAHVLLGAATGAAALADVLPLPGPAWLRSVASAGDLMLTCGAATFLARSMLRSMQSRNPSVESAVHLVAGDYRQKAK